MSRGRHSRPQPVALDSGCVTAPTRDEIAIVLRAAEDLITTGGRNLLTKILAGSKSREIRTELLTNLAFGA